MRIIEWDAGHTLDPRAYMAWLVEHGDELPPGARAFAADPNHYDYSSYRVMDEPQPPGTALCTKDLLLVDATVRVGAGTVVELRLMFPGYDPALLGSYDLTLTYQEVQSFSVETEQDEGYFRGLMIDEVSPDPVGAVHDLAFDGGRITITCADLIATWR